MSKKSFWYLKSHNEEFLKREFEKIKAITNNFKDIDNLDFVKFNEIKINDSLEYTNKY